MRACLAATAAIALLACGCASSAGNAAGSGGSGAHSAPPAAATVPPLTGFGATLAQWNTGHKDDPRRMSVTLPTFR